MRVYNENEKLFLHLRHFGERVTIERNKNNSDYIEYVQVLLPCAQKAFEEGNTEAFTAALECLCNSFEKWRSTMAISAGIYSRREPDLNRVGDLTQYDSQSEAFQIWNCIVEMTDFAKNSLYMTDQMGEDLLALFHQATDDLLNGTKNLDLNRVSKLSELLKVYDAFGFYGTLDTKKEKSSETLKYYNLLHQVGDAILNTRITAEDLAQLPSLLEEQRNVMQAQICTGVPFIQVARELYGTVSTKLSECTRESAKAVSDAMNVCDDIRPYADDVMCAQALEELRTAINGLVSRADQKIQLAVRVEREQDTAMVSVAVGENSDLSFGNFYLYYDQTALSFVSSEGTRWIRTGYNCVFFPFDCDQGLKQETVLARFQFHIEAQTGKFLIVVDPQNLRDSFGDLLCVQATPGILDLGGDDDGSSVQIQFGEKPSAQVKKGELVSVDFVPDKEGFVFQGWHTPEGQPVLDRVFAVRDTVLHAEWTALKPKLMRRGEIMVSGYIAVHTQYAIEADFKKIKEAGLDFVILDYVPGSEMHLKCIEWAQKYGLYMYIHDYGFNKDKPWTVEKVLSYTAPYRFLPNFLGNDYCDEPSHAQYPEIAEQSKVYMQALPGYDIHVNLFSDMGVEALLRGMDYTEYIRDYVQQVPTLHLSIDPYPLTGYNGELKTYDAYYVGLRIPAEFTQKYHLDYWTYIQTMKGNEQRDVSLADLRFQYYSSLAYGADKIMNYCYDCSGYDPEKSVYSDEVYCMRDYAHRYTKLYDYVQLVNQEVKTFAEPYSEYGWEHTGVHRGTGTIPGYVAAEQEYDGDLEVSCEDSLLIGSFSKAGGRAYMICNASELAENKTVTVQFQVRSAEAVDVYISGAKTTVEPSAQIQLRSGEGAYLVVHEISSTCGQ